MNEDLIKAKRYNSHPSGIEAKEIIRKMPFQLANVYKYVIRRNDKDSYKKDLEKALIYLNWEEEDPSVCNMRAISIPFDKLRLVIEAEPCYEAHSFLFNFYSYVNNNDPRYILHMRKDIKALLESGN